MAYSCKVHKESGGNELHIESGGVLDIKTGAVIKANGTQASVISNASVAHNLNSTFSDTEAEAALDALGGKINSIIAALKGAGIVALS